MENQEMLKIFFAFANEDRDVRDKLLRQMNLVKDREQWDIWASHEIKAGANWGEEIRARLADSEVVILLMSTDFFNSKYILDKELPAIIEKYRSGNCHIIPVLARECFWTYTQIGEFALLGNIQALPPGERPIVSKSAWDNDDEPYRLTVGGIKDSVRQYKAKRLGQKQLKLIGKQEIDTKKTEKKTVSQNKITNISPSLPLKDEEIREIANPKRPFPLNTILVIGAGIIALLLIWFLANKFSEKKQDQQSPSELEPSARKSGFMMVQVSGGSFTMGCKTGRDNDCEKDEKPAHEVTLSSFSIGKYEVTQADWREIMGNIPSDHKNCDECPVEQVSWNEIQIFLKKANSKFPGKNYRLPTEAEWEFAARGGNQSRDYEYSGGDSLEIVAWYVKNSNSETHPAGDKKGNELGICNMSGNVWEWCSDWYGSYSSNNQFNPQGFKTGSARIFRGGSWDNDALHNRTAYRGRDVTGFRNRNLGFRLVSVE